MQAIVADLTETRAAILAELDGMPNALVGSQKWQDRLVELVAIKRRLEILGVE